MCPVSSEILSAMTLVEVPLTWLKSDISGFSWWIIQKLFGHRCWHIDAGTKWPPVCSCMLTSYEDLCARSRYQGQGQVITSHRYCTSSHIKDAFDKKILSYLPSKSPMAITITSHWVWERPKSPASRSFAQPFVQAHINENIKAPGHWPLYGEFTGGRRIPHTKRQYRTKCLMTSSWCKTPAAY